MDWHTPQGAEFDVLDDGADLVVTCRWWTVRHSRRAGGNISSVVFPFGSGRNIFAAPFATEVGTGRGGAYTYHSNARDDHPAVSHGREGERVWVQSDSVCVSPDGKPLPVRVRHRFEYFPWGYVRQRVRMTFERKVSSVWFLQVARPMVAKHLDEFAYRPAHTQSATWRMTWALQPWRKLKGGEAFNDNRAAFAGRIPMYFLFLRRGVEGFDWFVADDLDQWSRQVLDVPEVNQFHVAYTREHDGYEVRLCPIDYWPSAVDLRGEYVFDFFMGLPFVQEHVPPLVRSIGGLLVGRKDRRGTAFPEASQIARYGDCGVQLTRLHNDGPSPDGVFWRDGAYPPYPPRRMEAMDRCIAALHRRRVRVAPYFSLHEFHPEVPPYRRKAAEWKRTVDAAGGVLHNYTPVGEFGAQMCLRSGWADFRKRSIEAVLANHAFDGVYYDWTLALACLYRGHAPHDHWDVEEYMDLLEWTRGRVGPSGVMYLHMSSAPFVPAENMASYILTMEEAAPCKVTPDMFPPTAHFMKTCPHGALAMGASAEQPRRFSLCALLNHVSVDSRAPEVLEVFRELKAVDFTPYTAFENHRTAAVHTSHPDVRAAIYWGERGAMVLLANLSEAPRGFTWHLSQEAIGWTGDRPRVMGRSPRRLKGLEFRYVRLTRTA